jgi:outer membrane protein assembly factor BamB
VVVTAADRDARRVLCYDANGGELLWARDVKAADAPAEPFEFSGETNAGYAAPTPATDGNRVCAVFPNGDIACFGLADGNERWSRNLHFGPNAYGYASSLDLAGGLVIAQIDQGGAEEGKSLLLALDAASGAVRWEVKRPVGASWSSPIVTPNGKGAMVLARGDPYLIAHDLADGGELWRARAGGGDGAPSPILAGDLALCMEATAKLSAVRIGGVGDVTETNVAWTAEDDVPDVTSPVSDGNRVWTLSSIGVLNCYELAGGKKLGSKEVHMSFQASPSLAGGRLYLLAENGTMLILEATPEAAEVARCELGEQTAASPAFAGGRIYVRGAKHLFCIGGAKTPAP